MARLGDILLRMGALQAPLLAEALDVQVIYGGRLGTCLLEVGAVTEEGLVQALGRQLGCPALWGELGVDPAAIALLTADRVDRLEVVPLRVDGRRLAVLARDPRDLRKLDEVAFATGKEVRAVLVAESRLFGLMRDHYGIHRPLRGVEAIASRVVRHPVAKAAVPGPDLMDEDGFAALYDQVAARPVPPPLPRRDAFEGALVSNDEVLAALQREAGGRAAPGPEAISITPPAAEAPPLSFDDAVRALAGVEDREAIARVVLRCARSRFQRAVLLTVRGKQADGWEGLGAGLTPQTIARIHVALEQAGIFHTVVGSRGHFLGPLQKTESNVRFLRALGGGAPRNSFAMPILARGQVVNVLYGDNGRGALVDSSGVGELLILSTKIAQSYDVLLSRAR